MPVLQGAGSVPGCSPGERCASSGISPSPGGRWADREGEIARFEQARQQAIAQLAQLHEDTTARLGEDKALLFEIHQMMLDDLDYRDAVTGMIQGEGVCAEYAVDADRAAVLPYVRSDGRQLYAGAGRRCAGCFTAGRPPAHRPGRGGAGR